MICPIPRLMHFQGIKGINMNNENLFDSNLTATLEQEIEEVDKLTTLRMDLDATLENAINELNALQDEYSQKSAENLVDLCKVNVMSTIVGQFGIASILLEAKDGGSVTTEHNFEKGIVATEDDKAKYETFRANNNGSRKWEDVRTEGGYDKPLAAMRKEAFKNQSTITDEYTGKELPKDGRAHLDHVVSAKEIESDSGAHLFMSAEERAKMATSKENLAWTEGSANQSKGDQKMEDWLNKEKNGESNEKRFGIDKERAMKKDKEARKFINNTINKEAFKKYSKELLVTGGKDAARTATYSAIGVIMHDLALAVVEELKYILKNRKEKTNRELFIHFKERMAKVVEELKVKWKEIIAGSFEAGIMAFLSNIVVFVINLFATTLKKLVSMIRAGFVSLCQALKTIIHPPAGMTQEDANQQAAKILVAGVVGALSLGLSASIEKFLQSIPGLQPIMMFPIPSFGDEPRTVSDVLAVTLSAVAGGLITTILLYYMDRWFAAGKKDKLQIQLIATNGVVMQCHLAQGWFAIKDAYDFLEDRIKKDVQACVETARAIQSENEKTCEGLKGWDAIKHRMKNK